MLHLGIVCVSLLWDPGTRDWIPPDSFKGHLVDLNYAFWVESGKYEAHILSGFRNMDCLTPGLEPGNGKKKNNFIKNSFRNIKITILSN